MIKDIGIAVKSFVKDKQVSLAHKKYLASVAYTVNNAISGRYWIISEIVAHEIRDEIWGRDESVIMESHWFEII